MKKEKVLPLNTASLNERINAMSLKREWLAQAIGVHPKTITRWTTGKVKRLSAYNAMALAQCLQCSVEELLDDADLLHMGSYADREQTVAQMMSEDLLQLLSPPGRWGLLEAIVRSSFSPNLRKDQIGRLYNWLSVAKWRQQDFAGARTLALKALELGSRIENRAICAKALYNLGTIASISGSHAEALHLLIQAYELKQSLTSADIASLVNNLAMVYRDMAEFTMSLGFQQEAVDLFLEENAHYNLAIAHNCFAFVYTEMGKFEESLEHLEKAATYSEKSNYQAGKVIIPLYQMDALVLSGQSHKAIHKAGVIEEYLANDYADYFCYEFIGRYFRFQGSYDAARSMLRLGVERCHNRPTERASLYHELTRLENALGCTSEATLMLEEGNRLYSSIGLPLRVVNGPVPEYGNVFRPDLTW